MTSASLDTESDDIIQAFTVEALSAAELEPIPEEAPNDLSPATAQETAEALALVKSAQMMVDALGITWAAFQLYLDPVNTESWGRAMDMFRTSDAYPALIEVGPDSFLVDGIEIEATVDRPCGVAREAVRS